MFTCLLPATQQLATFHIQPVIDLRNDRICGGEILWRPHGQPPSREAFEALDEDPVLNLRVGQESFLFALQHLSNSPSDAWLSINLSCQFISSSRAFFRPISKAVEDLDSLRRQVGKRLVIEVVEKGIAGPREREFINELSQLHTIAVDDFGVGEAPLSHMLAFNYSKVKVDRSIVAHCDSDLYRQRFLRWLTGGCQGIGVEICAEGVETESEAAFLRRLGIEQGQGWLWSPSVAPEQFEALCQPHDSVSESLTRLLNAPVR
jgi:EAL domain-containing protein (putative c-di-GMP-specific phosphodiesterase class I)